MKSSTRPRFSESLRLNRQDASGHGTQCRSYRTGQWNSPRTARIDAFRGLLREFGPVLLLGAIAALRLKPEAIDDEAVPPLIKSSPLALLDEIRDL